MELIQKDKLKLTLVSVFWVLLFLPYVQLNRFLDETDNLIGGMVIHSGGNVYGDYYSQHTPLMYYLTAIFTALGANSVESYRILFYLFLVGCFCFIYLRYRKYFGELPLALYPVIYICSLGRDGLSHMILSEQVQAQAMVVIFLELLLLNSTRAFKLDNKIVVSISSFVALGVAFMSIYAVVSAYAIIFLLLLQQEWTSSDSFRQVFGRLLIKYSKTFFILAIPFLIFITWYAASKNMGNLYLQAFWLNTHVYPKYNGGLGSDAFAPVINSLHGFLSSFLDGFFTTPAHWTQFLRIMLNKVVFFYFLFTFVPRRKILFFGLFFFVILNTLRGDLGFHSVPYWAITAIMLSLVLKELVIQSKRSNAGGARFFLLPVIAIGSAIVIIPYIGTVRQVMLVAPIARPAKEFSCEFFAKTLLAKDEGFFATSINLDQMCYIESQRLPSIKAAGVVPWFTDVFEAEMIGDLKRAKTKLIFHNPDNSVWGWVLKDYAPKLNEFILHNYRKLDAQMQDVYVRADFYEEALKRLMEKSPEFFSVRPGLRIYRLDNTVGEISVGSAVRQTFITEEDRLHSISVLMATYMRRNSSVLEFSLLDSDGSRLFHKLVDASALVDNSFFNFKFPSIAHSRGRRFAVEITAVSGKPGNYVTAWRSKADVYPDGALTINGKSVEGDLSIALFYER